MAIKKRKMPINALFRLSDAFCPIFIGYKVTKKNPYNGLKTGKIIIF